MLAEGDDAAQLPLIEGLSAVLAGSASKATNAQVAAWRETRPAFRIDPLAAARGAPMVEQALAFAQPYLDKGEPVLLYATAIVATTLRIVPVPFAARADGVSL